MKKHIPVLAVLVLLPAAGLVGQEKPKGSGDKPAVEPTQSGDPYNVYSSGAFQEVYIDEDFKLFKVRTYQGAVPGRDEENPQGAPVDPPKGKIVIDRIGFEQRELFSRIFVLADRPVSPWVYDNFVQAQSDPAIPPQIYVEVAKASIPRTNDRRPLVTKNFNTPVMQVEANQVKDLVRIVITLKREARYLPVQVGKTIYVDVER
jgi:hypothetical protein